MMYGSILYNCWGALLGFTSYFVLALQQPYAIPMETLIGSFVSALVVFLCTYPARVLLGYVLYTPEEVILEEASLVEDQAQEEVPSSSNRTSTVEFEDENAEEIAKVVRTMMHSEEHTLPNP